MIPLAKSVKVALGCVFLFITAAAVFIGSYKTAVLVAFLTFLVLRSAYCHDKHRPPVFGKK
jgi:hypothetical protein